MTDFILVGIFFVLVVLAVHMMSIEHQLRRANLRLETCNTLLRSIRTALGPK